MSKSATIKLSKYGDDLQVSPSTVAPGSVAFCAYGANVERVPAVATPAEWDAFVAAGDRALGREAGPTVSRAAVAAVVAEIDALECADEDAIIGIRRSLAALLAPSTEDR